MDSDRPADRLGRTQAPVWTDKETGKALTVAEIAYLIRGKIKREGIAARNVFAQVIANREQWIYQQLNDIEVSL